MSDAFKASKIGLVGFCPEVTQGEPNWDLTADGGVNTTTKILIDNTSGATHNNALALMVDGHLDHLQVYFRTDTTTAALQGKIYDLALSSRVTSVVTANVGETMAAAPAATDRFVLFAPLPASDVSISPGTENLDRPEFERQTLDKAAACKGLKIISGSFKWELPGLEQENGSGDTPRLDRFSQFLRAMGARRAVAGTTISGGASPDGANLDFVDASAMQVGDWVLVGPDAARITSIDTGATPDRVVVSPPLASGVPADTTEVFMGEVVTPDDTGHQSHTILSMRDTQLTESLGCVFSFGLSGSYAGLIEATAEFDGESWDLQDSYALSGAQSTKNCLPFVAGQAYFGTTAMPLNSFEFALGHGRQQLRDVFAGQMQRITTRDATLKCVFRNEDAVPKETWEAAGTQARLTVQVGNSAGACVVIAGNAQIQEPTTSTDVEGHAYWDATFAFRDNQTDPAAALKPQLIRF